MNQKCVGIMTWHYYSNFGSALQTYSLQNVLKSKGYKVSVINYINPKFGKHSLVKKRIAYLLHMLFSDFPGAIGRFCRFPFIDFQISYFNETKPFQAIQEIRQIADQYNISTIVFGSDQIWAPNCFNPIYFGEGINGKKISKISYAASIGLREIPQQLQKRYQSLLSDFAAISVRESDGKVLLNQFGIENVSVVLDPTLLLDVQDYEKLERKPRLFCGDDYVFCYFLNKDHTYRTAVEKLAKERNVAVLGVSAAPDEEWMHSVGEIGPREFLYYIHHAKAVVTDSYHGAIFSLLYHKELYIFERFLPDDPINQNSRIEQLSRWFGLSNCIVPGSCQKLPRFDLDYLEFEKMRLAAKEDSHNYLEEALRNALIYQR